jgi:hypothetical protein
MSTWDRSVPQPLSTLPFFRSTRAFRIHAAVFPTCRHKGRGRFLKSAFTLDENWPKVNECNGDITTTDEEV